MTHFLSRTALVLATASALTTSLAWAQMPKPNFPIALPKGADEEKPTATAEPDGSVRETPVMPATPAPEGVEARALTEAAVPRETTKPASVTRTETKTTIAGRVVSAEGPAKVHVVKKGDTLAAIGRDWDMDPLDIAKQNKLKSPYRLHPGDKIKGPKSSAKAYVVGQGDTLYAVARRFSVSAKALADANDVSTSQALKSGQKLILPAGFKDKGPTRIQVRVAGDQADEGTANAPPAQAPAPSIKPISRPTMVTKPLPVEAEQAAEPVARPTTTTKVSVTGKVVEFTGKPIRYTVRRGDAVDSIAHGMGMTRKEFADLNNLEAPYILRPGKVLKGPPQPLKAYVPVEGDTFALIAKRFSTTPKALIALNGKTVRLGKRLTLPDTIRDRGPVRETIRNVPVAPPESKTSPTYERPTAPVITPRPYTPPPVTQRPTYPSPISPTVSAPLTDAQVSALGRGRFAWPLKGELISDFGPKGTGQRNDGVNIRAHSGDAIRAAAAGDVVYAGDQVPGFGNLILVKHTEGWVTAYGHLARIDVKMQQKVVQGQQLGLAGDTGGVSEVQLHFEVRYAPVPTERARPVNPELVLGK
ncbi:MAG: LysM peptidoglycan-binding domain-containing protein [Alphaproteobacteria bacterium]